MPWFQPIFALNIANPAYLYFWANVSGAAHNGPGVFRLNVSAGSSSNATLVFSTRGANIVTLTAGGMVNSRLREDVAVAVSGSSLFWWLNGSLDVRALPTSFAEPCAARYNAAFCDSLIGVNFQSCSTGCQNWPNHGATMTLALHPQDASVLAVCGWASVLDNGGTERLYYSRDAGVTFVDLLTAELANAAQVDPTFSKVRVAALAFVGNVLLAGTARGVCASNIPIGSSWASSKPARWYRLGSTRKEFPLVKISQIRYYGDVDKVVVATMGRGVYLLESAHSHVQFAGSPTGAGGLGAGAAAAIVVSALVLVALSVFAVRWYLRRVPNARDASARDQSAAYRQFEAS